MRTLSILIIFCTVNLFAGPDSSITQKQFDELLKRAESGDASAQNDVGICYQVGWQVVPKQDHEEAFKWYKKSADQGFGSAQEAVGRSYAIGWGVPKDLVKAYAYFTLSLLSLEGESGRTPRTFRANITAEMTYPQIQSAKKLAQQLQQEIENKK